jgi:adenosine/AMP kinase
MRIREVKLSVPEGYQLILGQSHFIKTVEDLYEALASALPGHKFGIAFCESSGEALVRYDGTDDKATEMATHFALLLSAGHSFVVVLKGSYPINVLNRIKMLDEVVSLYCATANRVVALIGESGEGAGILGVIDGVRPKRKESAKEKRDRHQFLRKIGYKR